MNKVEITLPKNLTIENTNVNTVVAQEKNFSTGSKGYFVGGLKLVDVATGKRYQTQIQMVEIGSKPDVKPAKKGKGTNA